MSNLTFSPRRCHRCSTATTIIFMALSSLLCLSVLAQPKNQSTSLPPQPLAANDLLSVVVYQAEELSSNVRIDAEGQIRLPMLTTPVNALSLMPAQLEAKVRQAYVDAGILVNPMVTISVVEYASKPVSVIGAIRAPITFQADRPISLLEALTRAGGLSEDAGAYLLLSKTVKDDEGESVLTQKIAISEVLESAESVSLIQLRGGEEIRVPHAGKVFVVGNVKKPGTYRIPDEEHTTVLKALALGEGLLPNSTDEAFIYRPAEDGSKLEIPVDLKKILTRKIPDVTLLHDDVLYIPESAKKKATMSAIERALAFGSATLSGVLVWGLAR